MLIYYFCSFWDRSSIKHGSNVNWTARITRMIHMTAVKTPSPYRLSLWMGYIRYVDGTVGACQPPVHCTVVTVYRYGGQPYWCHHSSSGIPWEWAHYKKMHCCLTRCTSLPEVMLYA